jgi:DNA-binding NarL/FixJ family response regulator
LADRLSEEVDVTVVGACADGSEVVEAAGRLEPDVVCMDFSMPVMNGFEATEAVRAAQLDVRVVLLTAGSTTQLAAATVGADALVAKTGRPDDLLRCLRAIAAGNRKTCPHCL